MRDELQRFVEKVAPGPDCSAALEAIIDAESAPAIVTDSEEKVVLANARACSLLGLPSRDVVGSPMDLVLRQTQQSGLGLKPLSRPIRSTSGSVVGHFTIFEETPGEEASVELASLRRRLVEIEASNRHLRSLESTRNNLLSNVSHELRTPLVTIIGYVEMISALELGEIPEEVAASLNVVLRNALRLSSHIDDLLNLSRFQEDALEPHLEKAQLRDILDAAVDNYRMLLEEKNLEVQVDLPEDLPPAWIDRRLTGIALENLLKNAIKFSPSSGTIEITVRQEDELLRLDIRDEGPGIPPEHLGSVFEPFFQVDSSPTRSHGGIGVGLSIVRKIAEAQGGKVFIESDGRRGTTVTLELPRASR